MNKQHPKKPNNQQTEVWEKIINYLREFGEYIINMTPGQWTNLISRGTKVLIFFLGLIAVAFIIITLLKPIFTIIQTNTPIISIMQKNQPENSHNGQIVEKQVLVEATVGFQNSGIEVQPGDYIEFEAEGHIHLSLEQAYNSASLVKPIIIHNTSNKKQLEGIKTREWVEEKTKLFKPPTSNSGNIFYRGWIGPEGDTEVSEFFEKCKILQGQKWGKLLVTVMPEKLSAQKKLVDPFEIIKSFKGSDFGIEDLKPFDDGKFVAERKGYLTFIVNDAILSPHYLKYYPDSPDSKLYYDTLQSFINRQGRRPGQIYPSVPLTLFADNIGAFYVNVKINPKPQKS